MTRNHSSLSRFLAAAVLLAAPLSIASADKHQKHENVDKEHLAVQGYDVVSYFTSGKAAKGDKGIMIRHDGHIYRFSSNENRTAFLKAPEKYVPAYGGWCATAMAEGKKVEIDPANFKITDGRLLLFYKSFFADAKTDWNKDEKGNLKKADDHWAKIIAQ